MILAFHFVMHDGAASPLSAELCACGRRHGPGLSVHVRRNLQPKQIEHRGGDIRDGVFFARNLPVGKKDPWHQLGIYAVIAAPRFGIEFKDFLCDPALRGIPRCAVAFAESHDAPSFNAR